MKTLKMKTFMINVKLPIDMEAVGSGITISQLKH